MKTKQLSNHQIGVILSLSIISLKVLIYPAVIGRYSFNNCYLSVILSLSVDFLAIACILFVIKHNPDKTFFEMMESCFGKVFSKIIGSLLMVFFLFKAFASIKELQNYFVQLLFEEIQWEYFVLPLIALLIFMMNKSFRTFARSVEFFYYFIVIGAVLSVALPLNDIKFFNLLPILPDGIAPIVRGSFLTTFQFGDYLVFFLLMGRVKYSKKTEKTILGFVIFTDLIIVLFFIIFSALFGETVVNQLLAVSDVPLYSNMAYNNGRLEWISIIIWTIVLIFQSGIMLLCSLETMQYVTTIKNRFVLSLMVSTVIFVLLLIFYLGFADALVIITSVAFSVSIFVFKLMLLILSLIATWRNKNEKSI